MCCCHVGPFPHPRNRYWYSSNGSSWLCAHGKASPCLPGEVQLTLLPPPWAARPGRARAALWAPHTRHGAAPASPQCLPASQHGVGALGSLLGTGPSLLLAEHKEQQDRARWRRCCCGSAHGLSVWAWGGQHPCVTRETMGCVVARGFPLPSEVSVLPGIPRQPPPPCPSNEAPSVIDWLGPTPTPSACAGSRQQSRSAPQDHTSCQELSCSSYPCHVPHSGHHGPVGTAWAVPLAAAPAAGRRPAQHPKVQRGGAVQCSCLLPCSCQAAGTAPGLLPAQGVGPGARLSTYGQRTPAHRGPAHRGWHWLGAVCPQSHSVTPLVRWAEERRYNRRVVG